MLDRAERPVDHNQFGLVLLTRYTDVFNLARTEQQIRTHFADRQYEAVLDYDANGECKPFGLAQTIVRIEVIRDPADIGADDERPRPARYFAEKIVVETQLSSSSQSSDRSTGVAGWMVETACLYASCTYPSRSSSMQKRS